MRIKTIMTACLAVPALSVLCLLSSCSSEELTEKPSTGPQTLTLNLKPAGTRAAVYNDPASTTPNPENKINSVTIGIFDSYSNVKTIQDAADPSNPSITTSQLEKGDKVLVAVNAKKGTFAGAKTVTDFENKTLAIDDALANSNSSDTTVTSNNLPMFGIGTIDGSSPSFSADVTVYHMVAKITLKSLSVNFSTTGAYPRATFTPTEVFMSNVPDSLDFYPVVDANMTSYSKFAAYKTLCQGEESNKTNFKAYLGTTKTLTGFKAKNDTLSGISDSATSSWGTAEKILFLYTMPNAATTTPTRLVIKGMFDPDGPGKNAAADSVYYPVNINYNSDKGSAVDGGTVKQVYPNKNYIIDVTIQSKGSKSPTVAIDPEQATANITVQPFTDASQTNVFN